MLIVLAIITMVMSIGLPTLSRITYQRVASTTRKFVGTLRAVRNDAILLNKIHRLAINFEDQTWSVEAQNSLQLLDDPGIDEVEAQRRDRERGRKKGDKPPRDVFAPVAKYSKKPNKLPAGVIFDGVFKEKEGLVKTGTVYVFFFPSGYAERAIVYLNKEGSEGGGYSLVLRPATGKVDIFNRKVMNFDDQEVQS